MYKKYLYILLIIFLGSCGFKPIHNDTNLKNINIQKINYSGKNDLNYLVKNYLNLNENENSKGLVIDLAISETIKSATKNNSGITVEEDMTISIAIKIVNNENEELLTDNLSATKRLLVGSNISSDEEKKRIERNNLIRTLINKIKFKIQLVITQS